MHATSGQNSLLKFELYKFCTANAAKSKYTTRNDNHDGGGGGVYYTELHHTQKKAKV